jgi:cardiolipin synthase
LVLHEDGPAALERLKLLLREARETIEVSTFLVGHDAIGAELCALLAQRAGEGVRVRLMIDGVGRYLGGRPSTRALRRAGVRVRLFASPWSSPLLGGRANLRNHRKVAIADGQRLWSGGRNLAAEYFIPQRHAGGRFSPAWIDLSFDLQGPLVQQVRAQFEADWRTAGREAAAPQAPAVVRSSAAGPLAQFLPSGPDQGDDTVHALLVDACFNAHRRFIAVTPYFVPDAVLLMALVLAARRGIEVDVVVPRRSNHRLADLARPAALRELADAGARIWLAPQMVHAKLVVVDDSVAFCGSLNLDERSLFLNYEMMVAFYDAQAVASFAQWAQALRGTAQPLVRQRVGVLREFGEGLLRWLTFQL